MPAIAFFPALYGNDALKSLLGQDIAAGRFAHAYILEGPEGSGRRTAALQIAAAISCENKGAGGLLPCGQCLSCRKISRSLSPDVIRITADGKATLGVEAIRSMKENLYIPPNDTDHKVYVIEDAERMTVQAQNALLLSLEEPPAFVVFLLLTRDAGQLLPTVRSRAAVLRMQQFDKEEILRYFRKHPVPEGKTAAEATMQNAAALAGGCIGQALHLLEDGNELSQWASCREQADAFTKQLLAGTPPESIRLLNSLSRKREDIRALLLLVLMALRDLLALKKAGQAPLLFYPSPEAAREFTLRLTPAKLLRASDEVASALRDLEANVSVQSVLTDLLLCGNTKSNGRSVR